MNKKEPWDIQITGKDFILRHKRVILAVQLELGKTGTVLQCLDEIHKDRVLILCTKAGLYGWEE